MWELLKIRRTKMNHNRRSILGSERAAIIHFLYLIAMTPERKVIFLSLEPEVKIINKRFTTGAYLQQALESATSKP
jgi:hypothetical protein